MLIPTSPRFLLVRACIFRTLLRTLQMPCLAAAPVPALTLMFFALERASLLSLRTSRPSQSIPTSALWNIPLYIGALVCVPLSQCHARTPPLRKKQDIIPHQIIPSAGGSSLQLSHACGGGCPPAAPSASRSAVANTARLPLPSLEQAFECTCNHISRN